jgi:hypothetical protein
MKKNIRLYEKITYPSGRVRYKPTHSWNIGEPAPGIWLVEKNKRYWITKKLSDLSNPKIRFKLEQHRNKILNMLVEKTRSSYVWDDIVTKIFEIIEGDIDVKNKF